MTGVESRCGVGRVLLLFGVQAKYNIIKREEKLTFVQYVKCQEQLNRNSEVGLFIWDGVYRMMFASPKWEKRGCVPEVGEYFWHRRVSSITERFSVGRGNYATEPFVCPRNWAHQTYSVKRLALNFEKSLQCSKDLTKFLLVFLLYL